MAEQQEIFAADELEAIAKALGDTSEGLTGSEIRHILQFAQLCDVDPAATKWKRIHNAFVDYQNRKRSRTAILAFIRKAMKPTRCRGKQDHFETMPQPEWCTFVLWSVSARRWRAYREYLKLCVWRSAHAVKTGHLLNRSG